jgi:hypothetical protein
VAKNSDEPSGKGPRAPHQTSQPEIRVAYTPAGRQTLDAITEELVPLPLPVLPARAERDESSPEIVVRETFAERDTLAAIIAEAAGPEELLAPPPVPAAPSPVAQASGVEVFELVTFVVRGVEAAKLSSDALRRRFAEEHLLKRLPVASMDAVERVDAAPWTVQGTLVVRVWCRSVAG